jgi:hypothetical protein
MKKLLFTTAILLSCLSIQIAKAQIHVSLGLNIHSQPDWGPVGYDHADYYYMPDINAYYDVPNHVYVYNENNVWVRGRNLPARYGNYDRYHGYKVVVNQHNPWERNDVYRTRYASYRGRTDQTVIRDSRDSRYQDHWREDGRGNGHDNGNHNGQRDHRDKGDRGGHGDKGHDHGDNH